MASYTPEELAFFKMINDNSTQWGEYVASQQPAPIVPPTGQVTTQVQPEATNIALPGSNPFAQGDPAMWAQLKEMKAQGMTPEILAGLVQPTSGYTPPDKWNNTDNPNSMLFTANDPNYASNISALNEATGGATDINSAWDNIDGLDLQQSGDWFAPNTDQMKFDYLADYYKQNNIPFFSPIEGRPGRATLDVPDGMTEGQWKDFVQYLEIYEPNLYGEGAKYNTRGRDANGNIIIDYDKDDLDFMSGLMTVGIPTVMQSLAFGGVNNALGGAGALGLAAEGGSYVADWGNIAQNVAKAGLDAKQDENIKPPDIAWQKPDISDKPGDVQIQLPTYEKPPTETAGGGGGNESSGGTSGNTGGNTDTGDVGNDSVVDYQLWEAVGRAGSAVFRDQLIKEYEDYTGKKYDPNNAPKPNQTDTSQGEVDPGANEGTPEEPTDDLPAPYYWDFVDGEWVLKQGNAPDGTDTGTDTENTGGDEGGTGDTDTGGTVAVPTTGTGGTGGGSGGGTGGGNGRGNGDGDGDGDGKDGDGPGSEELINMLLGLSGGRGVIPAESDWEPSDIVPYDFASIFRDAEQEARFLRPFDSKEIAARHSKILHAMQNGGKLSESDRAYVTSLVGDR